MKKGDKVYISWQDIEAIGYGDSINTEGVIISSAQAMPGVCARHCVEYKEENYPYNVVRNWFYETDLRKIE